MSWQGIGVVEHYKIHWLEEFDILNSGNFIVSSICNVDCKALLIDLQFISNWVKKFILCDSLQLKT